MKLKRCIEKKLAAYNNLNKTALCLKHSWDEVEKILCRDKAKKMCSRNGRKEGGRDGGKIYN